MKILLSKTDKFLAFLRRIGYLAFCILSAILFVCQCTPVDTDQKGISSDDFSKAQFFKKQELYDSALNSFEKAALLAQEIKDPKLFMAAKSEIADCYRLKGRLIDAINVLDSALTIMNRQKMPTNLQPTLIYKKAYFLFLTGNYSLSNEYFDKTLESILRFNKENDTLSSLSYNGKGTNFFYLGEYDHALKNYQEAKKVLTDNGKQESADFAMYCQNSGIAYSVKGNYSQAQAEFDKSLEVYRRVLQSDDPKLGLLFLNSGRFYNLIGDDDKALELFLQAEQILSKNKESLKHLPGLYLNIGLNYVLKGNYEKARSFYDQAIEILKTDSIPNPANLLTAYLNLGLISEKTGNYASATENYLKGLKIGENYPNSIKILRNLANVKYLQKEHDEANSYYQRAVELCTSIWGADNTETALTYLKYGEFLSLTGQSQNALGFLKKALGIYIKTFPDKSRDKGLAYNYLGNYYYRIKDYSAAIRCYHNALLANFSGFNDRNIHVNPTLTSGELNYYQLVSLTGKAGSLFSLYNKMHDREMLRLSAETYQLAIDMIEKLRSSYLDEDSKLQISGNEKRTFSNAMRPAAELYKLTGDKQFLENAFSYSEKSKSAVLLAYLRDAGAKDIGNIPREYRDAENSIKSQLAFYNKSIYEEKTKPVSDLQKISIWNKEVFNLNRELDSLVNKIEKEFPSYYTLKYNNSVIKAHQISQQISDDEALIEYSLSDSVLYIFVVTRTNSQMLVYPLDKNFFSGLATLRKLNSGNEDDNYSPESFDQFVNSASHLYNILIKPVEEIISNKNIIIVPDGELGYLSFDILLTSKPDHKKQSYRNLPYLIREKAISYAPSATTYFVNFAKKKRSGTHLTAAFAPDYSNISEMTIDELAGTTGNKGRLLPLPGTRIELAELKKVFKTRLFSGRKATEANFKKYAPNYSLLHLGMHTLLNEDNPLYSKLVFYHDPKNRSEDGLLNTSELFGMQLNAELAVLSACNTGSGKLFSGEGIMSVTRGFFYAGVPSVVMSAWTIEDRSSPEIISSFYRYLAEGKEKNEALRLAKLDFLDHSDQLQSHPHYWAAYMIIGDNAPLDHLRKANPQSYLFLIITAIIAVLAVSFFIWRRYHYKQ